MLKPPDEVLSFLRALAPIPELGPRHPRLDLDGGDQRARPIHLRLRRGCVESQPAQRCVQSFVVRCFVGCSWHAPRPRQERPRGPGVWRRALSHYLEGHAAAVAPAPAPQPRARGAGSGRRADAAPGPWRPARRPMFSGQPTWSRAISVWEPPAGPQGNADVHVVGANAADAVVRYRPCNPQPSPKPKSETMGSVMVGLAHSAGAC